MTRRAVNCRVPLRTAAAVALGRLGAAASRRAGRGGTALPGLIAQGIDARVLERVAAQLGHGSVIVTGTNGKTTTARMIAAIAAAAGWQPLHNRSGSNLMRGLTATAVAGTSLHGRLAEAARSVGVFEVDEATLPQAAAAIRPRVVVFTNLFRDQLDRYGEVDSIAALWRRALDALDRDAALVLNADDPSVAALADAWEGPILRYGVDDPSCAGELEHAADARWCAQCGAEYDYAALYFGHIGIWRCPGCRRARPAPDVAATSVRPQPDAGDATALSVQTPARPISLRLPLAGLYNAYNALAAITAALRCGLDLPAIHAGLTTVEAAFGRQERLRVGGRTVRLLLCKNPAGANQVLRLLAAGPGALSLLILLNDGDADGRDISWIWDVDYEQLRGRVERVVVAGRRAADMALRLHYAGWSDALTVEPESGRAVRRALAATPEHGCLSVLPTYTAMLDVREQLARLAGRSHFWEE